MSNEVFVIGAGRTDFKRNFKKEGKTLRDIVVETTRETLKDETFRRTLHELVRRRSQAILDRLLGNGERRIPSAVRPRRRRTR